MMPATKIKTQYCPVCKCDTQWEYVSIQTPDGVFGIQNLVAQDAHRVSFWRCCNHSLPDGRMKPAFKHLTKHALP